MPPVALAIIIDNPCAEPIFAQERVGRFIRKTSLDELPRLIKILRGDMSIVGLHPALSQAVEKYKAYQVQRLLVQSELTCYWQVRFQCNSLSFDDWTVLDIKYIRERSFRTDWKMNFGIFRAVISMNGE